MNLCYLYKEQTHYPYKNELLKEFDDINIIDLSVKKPKKSYNIYIVDIHEFNKELSSEIKSLLKDKSSSLIYFIQNKSNISFYQLAFLLKVKSIITIKQDVSKIVSNIKNNYLAFIHDNKSLYVGSFITDSLCYMIFKNKSLYYVSDTLMKNFELSSKEEVEEKICSKLDLVTLLSHRDITIESRSIFDESMIDIVKSIYKNGEYLIVIDRINNTKINNSNIYSKELTTRLKFIDFLKNIIQNGSSEHYSLITINITNFKNV